MGDKGDNVLSGTAGNDTLTGGGGSDVFLFDTASQDTNANPLPNGRDVITDFKPHQDKIVINMLGVTSFADLAISHGPKGTVVITCDENQDTMTLPHTHGVSAGDFIFGTI